MTKRYSPTQFLVSVTISYFFGTIITAVFRTIFGNGTISTAILWQVAAIAVLVAALQSLFFTVLVIKRIGYPLRVFFFLLCLFAVIAAFAIGFRWFPVQQLFSWVIFTGVFLGIGGVTTVIITLYYARKGQSYTQQLKEYQNSKTGG